MKTSRLPLYFVVLFCAFGGLSWAQAGDSPPGDDEESIARVREIIRQARSIGTVADPDEASSRWIVAELRDLGEAGVPGALALLSAGTEEPAVLGALLEGLAASVGMGDDRVCAMARRDLAAATEPQGREPMWAALKVLKDWRVECSSAVDALKRLFVQAEDPELRFEIIEILSWVGQNSEDVLVVQELAAGPVSDCERRLLAAASLRIMDRFIDPDPQEE